MGRILDYKAIEKSKENYYVIKLSTLPHNDTIRELYNITATIGLEYKNRPLRGHVVTGIKFKYTR